MLKFKVTKRCLVFLRKLSLLKSSQETISLFTTTRKILLQQKYSQLSRNPRNGVVQNSPTAPDETGESPRKGTKMLNQELIESNRNTVAHNINKITDLADDLNEVLMNGQFDEASQILLEIEQRLNRIKYFAKRAG